MAPRQQSRPTAKRAVTFCTKPGKGEVKVSVVNIRGPYSADTIRPADVPATSSVPVSRPKPLVPRVTAHLASTPVSSSTLLKQQQMLTTQLQIGSCLNKDGASRRTGSSAQRMTGHSPGLRPLRLAGICRSGLKECLIIQSLHHQIQKTTPGPATV